MISQLLQNHQNSTILIPEKYWMNSEFHAQEWMNYFLYTWAISSMLGFFRLLSNPFHQWMIGHPWTLPKWFRDQELKILYYDFSFNKTIVMTSKALVLTNQSWECQGLGYFIRRSLILLKGVCLTNQCPLRKRWMLWECTRIDVEANNADLARSPPLITSPPDYKKKIDLIPFDAISPYK